MNTGVFEPNYITHFDLSEDRHALLRVLLNKVRGIDETPMGVDLSRDFIAGRAEDEWYFQEHLLKPWLELLLYDQAQESPTKVDVLEFNSSSYVFSKNLLGLADESLLCDTVVINYSVMHPTPSELDSSMLSSVKEVSPVI